MSCGCIALWPTESTLPLTQSTSPRMIVECWCIILNLERNPCCLILRRQHQHPVFTVDVLVFCNCTENSSKWSDKKMQYQTNNEPRNARYIVSRWFPTVFLGEKLAISWWESSTTWWTAFTVAFRQLASKWWFGAFRLSPHCISVGWCQVFCAKNCCLVHQEEHPPLNIHGCCGPTQSQG